MALHDNKEKLNSLLWDAASDPEGAKNSDDEEIRETARHIESCDECRKEYERILKIKSGLSEAYAPGEDLHEKLAASLRGAKRQKKSFLSRHLGTVAAAAVILIAVGAMYLPGMIRGSMAENDASNEKTYALPHSEKHISGAVLAPGVTGNDRDSSGKAASEKIENADSTLQSTDNPYTPDKIRSSFNALTVSGTDRTGLLRIFENGHVSLYDDAVTSDDQVAVSEADAEYLCRLLEKNGVKIEKCSVGSYPKFTLIQIK